MHTNGMIRMFGALAASVLLMASTADATVKCRAALVKESGKITQAIAKSLQKCEEGVRAGKITGPCPDAGTASKIAGAKAKTGAAVAKACAGATGEFNFGSCPNAQGPNGTATCGSILVTSKTAEGDCLACLGEEHAQESAKASYGAFVNAGADKTLGKCQAAIGKSAAGFFVARSKILAKCQGAIIGGKLTGTCAGDQATVDAIAKAQTKMQDAICKACGGPDKLCDGVDDYAPGAIGFPANCQRFQVDGGLGAGVVTLSDLVSCLVAQNVGRTDCTDAQALPQDATPSELGGLPSQCQAGSTSCASDGGNATIAVSIANASGGDLGAINISVGYRGVTIPGIGVGVLGQVTNLQNGFVEAFDNEAAIDVSIADLGGLVDGPLFEVAGNTCAVADALSCVVTQASNTEGAEILEGVSCTASVQ
jgi:hypothetical protein